jgi:hypothetical protein
MCACVPMHACAHTHVPTCAVMYVLCLCTKVGLAFRGALPNTASYDGQPRVTHDLTLLPLPSFPLSAWGFPNRPSAWNALANVLLQLRISLNF